VVSLSDIAGTCFHVVHARHWALKGLDLHIREHSLSGLFVFTLYMGPFVMG